jgi:hypothetical protein
MSLKVQNRSCNSENNKWGRQSPRRTDRVLLNYIDLFLETEDKNTFFLLLRGSIFLEEP